MNLYFIPLIFVVETMLSEDLLSGVQRTTETLPPTSSDLLNSPLRTTFSLQPPSIQTFATISNRFAEAHSKWVSLEIPLWKIMHKKMKIMNGINLYLEWWLTSRWLPGNFGWCILLIAIFSFVFHWWCDDYLQSLYQCCWKPKVIKWLKNSFRNCKRMCICDELRFHNLNLMQTTQKDEKNTYKAYVWTNYKWKVCTAWTVENSNKILPTLYLPRKLRFLMSSPRTSSKLLL